MKTKISNAFILERIGQKLSGASLPIKTMYKVVKLMKAVDTEAEFYRTQMTKIIQDYAQKDENGNPVPMDDGTGFKLQPDAAEAAQKAVEDLVSIDIELPDVKFKLDDLGDIELSAEETLILMEFIEE